ncbi:formate dehydrogenase accessory sulfurtransferase FdhD [Nocardioides zeae]|uniref:Sulfur carrier protein FdhD n=1 Tax=Nocardioides imazamoxiresistens TaxID=3231893 RepID=A0ABU3Q2B9_9ACTN|nr:formate dehydrogenase accessory sulfurtransferase FdhD [Nocardioides zeae]MDT9595182.1 formate dehydrogenase accessory sulfurtransferase FdhD [Nocardioides zeae]
MSKKRVRRVRAVAHHLTEASARHHEEQVAVEEPLEMRVGGEQYAVTMRTPGDDFDLVAGFLVGDGVVRGASDLMSLRYCAGVGPDGLQTYNVVDAGVSPAALDLARSRERRVEGTSACGVCGLASLDAVATISSHDLAADTTRVDPGVLAGLPDALRERQKDFDRTGGVHAAGLFDADGTLLCLREDVGRHNAVDKVVGWAHREGRLPLGGTVLQVSGRASFELAQKAVMAGIPVLAAVGAPSSLAVDLARRSDLTLVGFSRGDRFTVYAGADRVPETTTGTALSPVGAARP